jgi:polyphosphate kinase 2 (PPK2 family)
VAERGHWDAYMRAYEKMLGATSTPWAPWYVIPADHKWVSRALVANILTTTIRKLDLAYPTPTAEDVARIKAAGKQLKGE